MFSRTSLLFLIVILVNTYAEKLRIKNGFEAENGRYPYQVYLRHKNALNNIEDGFYCGGSIIHPRFVLTAGHCVNAEEASSVEIVAGSNKLGGIDAVYYQAELFIMHENFTDIENVNYADIALIRLTRDMIFNDRIQPVKLATVDYPYRNGLALTLSGWGRQGIPDRTHLNAIRMRIDDFDRCRRLIADVFLSDSRSPPRMDRSTMCLRPLNVVTGGTCTGDSGGPYVDDAGYQVGVVSWAAGCGEYAIYGISEVATYVPYYAHWIVNKVLSFN
ncbi:hypothetical protein TKK_0013940 [Trichogramma kaykai]|uniref:Peptidase S1 domain-containing protein n=1 Tax=Trichogramma kaykai TaxID=54128 RepID=A0ABD2WF31_9HYME